MVKVDHELVIDRPVAEVFTYLTDVDSLTEWQASVVGVRRETDGPTAVGTRFVEDRSALGRQVSSTIEVIEHEPDRIFSVRVVSGPVRFRVTHTFEALDGQTRLRVHGEGDPHGVARMAGMLVARQARREFERDFARLKELLEARADG